MKSIMKELNGLPERIKALEIDYRRKGQHPTYNELFFESINPDWRWRIEAETDEERKLILQIIEETVRDAMLSEGISALARHIEHGGILGPMLRDFLVRHLRGEKNLLPRGNKRTDAQIQKERLLVYKVCNLHFREGLTIHGAISRLLDEDPALNRKNLEALITVARRKPRWGIAGLYSIARGE